MFNRQSSNQPSVAFVTGATGAIGQAIARQLAEGGFEVVLGCRDKDCSMLRG